LELFYVPFSDELTDGLLVSYWDWAGTTFCMSKSNSSLRSSVAHVGRSFTCKQIGTAHDKWHHQYTSSVTVTDWLKTCCQ